MSTIRGWAETGILVAFAIILLTIACVLIHFVIANMYSDWQTILEDKRRRRRMEQQYSK